MQRNTIYKYTGAAAVLFASVLASPAAYAYGHGGYGGHGGGYYGGHHGGHGGHYGGGYYGGHHGGHGGHYGGHHGGHGGHYGGGYYGGHHPHYGGGYYGGGYYYGSFYAYCRNWGFYHNDRRCYRAFGGYYYSNEDLGIKDLKFKDVGGRLVVEGTLSGLTGSDPVQLDLEANSDVRSSCGKVGDVQSLGSRSMPGSDADLVDLQIEGEDTAPLAEGLVDCPNAQPARINDVQFVDARVDVTQGDKVLTLLCTFMEPTVDGDIAPENVECSAF